MASLPVLSAAAPFKCGGRSGPYSYTDIAAGPLAIKDVADIYPYPNTLRVVKVDGATLGEWLDARPPSSAASIRACAMSSLFLVQPSPVTIST